MNAYLENVLSLQEYQGAKNILINQKQVLKDKIVSFERKSNNRFELAINFIKTSKQGKILAKDDNLKSQRDFIKNIGSNFKIKNQKIFFEPRGAWQILMGQCFGALRAPIASAEGGHQKRQNFEFETWRRR